MECEGSLEFSASMEGLPLSFQLEQTKRRRTLIAAGPESWRETAQMADAFYIQLRREHAWRRQLTDRLFENGIPIPLPDDLGQGSEA